MFLIYIEKENSLSRVSEEALACDLETVKVGDEVKFAYEDKIHSGIVRLRSGKK